MLELQHIHKFFNPGSVNEICLFDDFNLTVKDGEFVSVVGSNGSGKTSMLNIICGSIDIDHGQILIDGKDYAGKKDFVRSRQIGRVFQDPSKGTCPQMTILENMSMADHKGKFFGLSMGTNKSRIPFYQEQLRQLNLGLEDKLHVKVGSLSGGQRQAMSLLMSTMTPIDFLILDEHTAALDPGTAEKVLNLTRRIVEEHQLTCLMITHNMQSAIDLGNRILMMDSGNIVLDIGGEEKKDMTVDGDLIIGCGAADGKIVLDNVTVKGRLLVWGGGTKAVYCNNGTQMPEVVVARVDDAVKVIYDRDSTLAVIDTIKVRITERAKQHKETEVIFYDVSGLREAQKQLNAIVADNQIALTAPAHLYALVGETDVKAEFTNNSKNDTYKIEIRRNKDNTLIADAFELAAGKSISTLTLLEAPEFGNVDCTVTITAYRDGKQIGTMQTELVLHTAYLWPKEVQ